MRRLLWQRASPPPVFLRSSEELYIVKNILLKDGGSLSFARRFATFESGKKVPVPLNSNSSKWNFLS